MDNSRSNQPIPSRLRFRFGVAFATTALTAVFVQSVLLNVTLRRLAGNLPHDASIVLESGPAFFFTNVLVALVVSVPLALVIGSVAVAKVASPAERLEDYLRSAIEGRTAAPCKLQSEHELQELCALVNRLVELGGSGWTERRVARATVDDVASLVSPERVEQDASTRELAD